MSSCCFQSPITYLGSGQYWVNISVLESDLMANNSFTVLFGGLYHFPLPIVIDQNQKPAPCRLDNPNDLDGGSMWTCTGYEARFRIDTNPKGIDPVIHQLSTKTFGECFGRPVCTSTVDTVPSESNANGAQEENNKVNLGALGTFDKGPVIAAFTLSSFVVICLVGLYFYRNRHKEKSSGQKPRLRLEATQGNSRSLSSLETPESENVPNTTASSKSTLLDSFTKKKNENKDKAKAKRPMNSKNLLALMNEKSDRPKNSGPLVVPSSSKRENIILQNDIDDGRSDKSNVPLALLFKN